MLTLIFSALPQGASAEEQTVELATKEGELVTLDEIPADMQASFIMEGFTDEDEFFLSTVFQTDTSTQENTGRNLLKTKVNVVTLAGSTKRQNATTAYTKYLIKSNNSPLISANTKVTLGNTVSTMSSVLIYGKPNAFNGGVYSNYNGKSKYFTVKAVSQVTTGMGPVSAWKTIGGVTLGK